MTFSRRLLSLTIAALLCTVAVPAAASAARTPVAVGLGDQSAAMFDAPAYQALKLKKTRFYIRWDAAKDPGTLAAADAYVAAARAHGVRVLMHISTNDFAIKKAKLPSVASYRKYVGMLVKRYRAKGVREWGVWNEANHASQPTYRSPTRAASYFKTMRRLCSGCTIVALDVLDQAGVERYIQRFMAALGSYRRYVRTVGIHNYSDTNRKRSTGTRSIIRTVHRYRKSAALWLTETGGVVEFGSNWRCSRIARGQPYQLHVLARAQVPLVDQAPVRLQLAGNELRVALRRRPREQGRLAATGLHHVQEGDRRLHPLGG